jgi:hypothetical protein
MDKSSKDKNRDSEGANDFKKIFIKGQLYKDVMSKNELWQTIADMYNGEFEIKQTVSKDINIFNLTLQYSNQRILLTESDTKPLSFETELLLNSAFEFNIYWNDFFEKISKVFSKLKSSSGNVLFDKKYAFTTSDFVLFKGLLNYKNIDQKILKHNFYSVILSRIEKSEKYKLHIVKDRNTTKLKEIIELIEFHISVIDFFINKKLILE